MDGLSLFIAIVIVLWCLKIAYKAHLWDSAINRGNRPINGFVRGLWDFRKGYKQRKNQIIDEEKERMVRFLREQKNH